MNFMRILLTAAIAASLAAGTMSALAQTTPSKPAKPAKPAACKTLKAEAACTTRTDCAWTAPTEKQKTGKCKTAPKKKS
jgi:hypothetical protein